ncbi:MAG: hypothetical protein KAH95_13980, partial [Spirochaetales bacterium]|nr:hypothetical protein [Spirochaetales bacterium]
FGYEAANLPENDFLILRSTLAMKSEDLDDFFRRFREGIIKLSALKELESMEPGTLEGFISRIKKVFLPDSCYIDISLLPDSNKPADQICGELKMIAANELRTILEE